MKTDYTFAEFMALCAVHKPQLHAALHDTVMSYLHYHLDEFPYGGRKSVQFIATYGLRVIKGHGIDASLGFYGREERPAREEFRWVWGHPKDHQVTVSVHVTDRALCTYGGLMPDTLHQRWRGK